MDAEVQGLVLGHVGPWNSTQRIVGAYIPECLLCVRSDPGTCNAQVGVISEHLYSARRFAHVHVTLCALFSCVKDEKPKVQRG